MNTLTRMRPIKLILLTPFYMAGQGTMLGLYMGFLFGTFIVPIFGSAYGFGFGGSAGLVAGAILGLIYAILLLVLHVEGIFRIRKWLHILIIGTVTVFLLYSLIDLYVAAPIYPPHPLALIPGAVPFLFFIVAAIYGTDKWIDWLRRSSPRKLKRPQHVVFIPSQSRTFGSLFKTVFRRVKGLAYLIPVAAMLITFIHAAGYSIRDWSIISILMSLMVGFSVYLLCQIVLLTATITPIVVIANRYLFTADTDPRIYKRNLSILTFCLVLPSQLVVAAFFGAPLAAIIATLAVRDYADWVHSPEKQKAKPKVPSQVTTSDVLDEAPIP